MAGAPGPGPTFTAHGREFILPVSLSRRPSRPRGRRSLILATRRKKPARKRRGRKRGAAARRRLRLKVSLYGLAIVVVAAAAALVWVDRDLVERFRQRQIAAPARVYSRPVEWFPGSPVDRQRAIETLRSIGYRQTKGKLSPGNFSVGNSRIDVATRAFEYSDAVTPADRVRVEFDGASIARITRRGVETSALTLDPVVIGSLADRRHEDREILRLHEVPDRFLEVLLMVEDRHFMSHPGIDPVAIIRALWNNILSGRVTQGGSTISQQLVKNLYLSSEQTLSRKAIEALYAIVLELHFDKHEILEAYINEVFLAQAGNRAIHGFGLGAEYFFGRSLAELDTADYALLVGMVKAPSAFNPRRHPERAVERRNVVLSILAEEGLIDESQLAALSKKPLGVVDAERGGSQSNAGFIDLVRRQVVERGVSDLQGVNELNVWSTLDPVVQRAAEDALAGTLSRIESQKNIPAGTLQGAIVVLRAENGEVVALVGDRRRGYAGFNRALDARRPVGSLLKPVIALTALESPRGYHLATPVEDAPLSIELKNGKTWSPGNYDGEFHGVVPLMTAIERSYNVASARLGLEVGVGPFVARLSQLALDETPSPFPSALLGAVEMSPLEVARLYLPFASGGLSFPPRAYVTATDGRRRVLSRNPSATRRLINPDTHYLVHFLLRGVVDRGTAQGVLGDFGRRMGLAGKTGTTDDFRDSWFAGYSGNYLAVVWVGRDDNRPTGLSGSTGALPVWRELMRSLPLRRAEFDVPGNVDWLTVDAVSGYRVGRGCDTALQVPFIDGGPVPPRGGCGATATVKRGDGNAFTRLLNRLFSGDEDAPSDRAWQQNGRR